MGLRSYRTGQVEGASPAIRDVRHRIEDEERHKELQRRPRDMRAQQHRRVRLVVPFLSRRGRFAVFALEI
jgi:hypothetical protein